MNPARGAFRVAWFSVAILSAAGCAALLTEEEKRQIVEEGQAAATDHYWSTKWKMCDAQTSGQLNRLVRDDEQEYQRWVAFCR